MNGLNLDIRLFFGKALRKTQFPFRGFPNMPCMFKDMPGTRNNRCFPGHALHEKGLQRQKGVVPLVGSQEQRALLVPPINRS